MQHGVMLLCVANMAALVANLETGWWLNPLGLRSLNFENFAL